MRVVMTHFETVYLADAITVEAPDGARVDLLPGLAGGTMARFSLEAGQVSRPVKHKTVEEIWYVIEGRGEMWRKGPDAAATGEAVTPLRRGPARRPHLIPLGTAFQFRAARRMRGSPQSP